MKLIGAISGNTRTRFLALFLFTFSGLYLLNLFWIGACNPGGWYVTFIHDHLNYIDWWRRSLLAVTSKVIQGLGFQVIPGQTTLMVPGKGGILLSYSCLGYGVCSFLIAFILAWPGYLYSKIRIFMGGIALIQALNVIRLTILSLYWRNSWLSMVISHHWLFNILIYGIVLLMLYRWTKTAPADH